MHLWSILERDYEVTVLVCGSVSLLFFGISAGFVSAYGQAPITLSVDLRDAPRKLLDATEIIPVHPDAMTLAYPKWIGNEHEFGPIGEQAGLFITGHQDGLPITVLLLSLPVGTSIAAYVGQTISYPYQTSREVITLAVD